MALAPQKIAEELSSSLQVLKDDVILPSIPYDREALDEIIEELEMSSDVKARLSEYLEYIEKQVSEVKKYQAKRHPENFYQAMRIAILGIRNTAVAIYELTKPYHQTLSNILKELILKWIIPLEAELDKRLEMPASHRDELDLKTKYLYAEQSFISRQASPQQALMRHLEKLKELLLVSSHPAPRCYISYAWPSEQHKAQEYWVQPFLFVLYDHLKTAGIRVVMDIRDNNPGDSIYQFMKQYHDGNYIILIGTESLLQKHYGEGAHAVQTELSIINNRFEQDQSQFGQSRIYPLLISGTIKGSYPEIYDKYRTVRDARDFGYVGTLKRLIDWVYEASIKQKVLRHSSLWQSFYKQSSGLPKKFSVVEGELSIGYHQQRLEFLRQDIQYQAVQAQEHTRHSQAAQTEQIGVLMKSQGINPQLLYDTNGFQFQRPYTNPDFIDRQGLWEKMTNHFAKSDQQILTLTAHGLGGMGKTELAQYYYQHPPRPYTLRAWFSAEIKENLSQQYVELAAEHPEGIKFPKEMSIEEQAKRAKSWLESQKDCLLVYDNVTDAKEIEGLLPERGKHHILMTSRNEVDWPAHQKLDVDVMEEYEAIDLIVKITNRLESEAKLKTLVQTLGYLPLALAQAGAYMVVKSLSIDDYLKLYLQYQAKLLSDRTPRSPKHEPVWVTFDMNLEALKAESPMALLSLKQASLLNHSAIPEILLQLLLSDEPTNLDLLWGDIKEHVRRYSLMRVDIDKHQLSIHPLLQEIVCDQQENIERVKIFQRVCEVMNALIIYYHKKGILEYKNLLLHAETLHHRGKIIAKLLKSDAVVKLPTLLKTEPAQLNTIYFNMRLSSKSLEFCKQQLEVYQAFYGKNHPMVAITLNNLGNAYGALGQTKQKKMYLKQALEINENYYGKNHTEVAVILINLGIVYVDLGDSKKAIELLKRALTIQEYHYGRDHLEIVAPLTNLGYAYNALGDIEQAKTVLEHALAIGERCYNNNHPTIATILTNVGDIYGNLGQWDQKIVMLKRALEINEQHYGKDHPEITVILISLGNAYGALQDIEQAKKCLERALEINERHYGKNHPMISTNLTSLGEVYRASGDFRRAKELLERALEIKKLFYGREHPETVPTSSILGLVYLALGDPMQAKQILEQVLEINETYYGKSHPEVAKTLVGLAVISMSTKAVQFAWDCLKRAKVIYMQDYLKEHPYLTQIKKMMQELLDKNSNTFRSSLLSQIHECSQKGMQHYKVKEYDHALNLFRQALVLLQDINDVPNEDMATLFFNIGSIYLFQKDYQLARVSLQSCYDMRLTLLGASHTSTQKAHSRLEECQRMLEQSATSTEMILENKTEHLASTESTARSMVFSVIGRASNTTEAKPENAPSNINKSKSSFFKGDH